MRNIHKFLSCIAVALNALAVPAAFAGNPWEPGGSLDKCIEATIKERRGGVAGWQQSGGGEEAPYLIAILNVEGTSAAAFCDPVTPSDFKSSTKTGLFRYSTFQRAT